ncbi:reverse transcriptase domain-containing protein [Tanacetum coccineum]
MPSPNYPTSNIEDAVSSNFPNYLPASPDYFLASPGNTYSSSSNNSFGLVPIASPTLSLFHDNPYMKIPPPKDTETLVESPIPISPSSSVGSSSPVRSTTPPPDYPFDESIFAEMPPKRTSTSEAPAMTQAAIKKLVADSWNAYAQPIGIDQANRITWIEFKRLLTNKYCPRTEVRKMVDELYNLTVKGNDLKPYVRRFQELAVLCPNMVPNTEKLLEAFIEGLPRSIKGNVTASKPQTLEEAINIAQRLIDQVTKHTPVQGTNDHKRKFDDERNTTNNNNYPNDRNNNNHSNNHNNNNYQDNRNNNNRNNDYHHQQNRRQETIRTYAATPTENKRSLHCQVSDLQQNGSSDQKLQKQRTLGLLD